MIKGFGGLNVLAPKSLIADFSIVPRRSRGTIEKSAKNCG